MYFLHYAVISYLSCLFSYSLFCSVFHTPWRKFSISVNGADILGGKNKVVSLTSACVPITSGIAAAKNCIGINVSLSVSFSLIIPLKVYFVFYGCDCIYQSSIDNLTSVIIFGSKIDLSF